jgi:hypothetical protein
VRSNAGEEHADRWAPPVSGEKKKGNRKGKETVRVCLGGPLWLGWTGLIRSKSFSSLFFCAGSFSFCFLFCFITFAFVAQMTSNQKQMFSKIQGIKVGQ